MAFARQHFQLTVLRKRNHRDHLILAGSQIRCRDLDQLVALAFRQRRQLGHRKNQQPPLQGDGGEQIGFIGYPRRLQYLGAIRQRDQRLAGFILAQQLLELHAETVAGIAGQHIPVVGIAGEQMGEKGTRRRIKASCQWLALSSGRRQIMRGRAVSPAGRIEHINRLSRPGLDRIKKTVAGAVAQTGDIDVMAFSRPDPAFLRQNNRQRFIGDQLGRIQRLRSLSCNDRRAAIIAVFLGIALEFLSDQAV